MKPKEIEIKIDLKKKSVFTLLIPKKIYYLKKGPVLCKIHFADLLFFIYWKKYL